MPPDPLDAACIFIAHSENKLTLWKTTNLRVTICVKHIIVMEKVMESHGSFEKVQKSMNPV